MTAIQHLARFAQGAHWPEPSLRCCQLKTSIHAAIFGTEANSYGFPPRCHRRNGSTSSPWQMGGRLVRAPQGARAGPIDRLSDLNANSSDRGINSNVSRSLGTGTSRDAIKRSWPSSMHCEDVAIEDVSESGRSYLVSPSGDFCTTLRFLRLKSAARRLDQAVTAPCVINHEPRRRP